MFNRSRRAGCAAAIAIMYFVDILYVYLIKPTQVEDAITNFKFSQDIGTNPNCLYSIALRALP